MTTTVASLGALVLDDVALTFRRQRELTERALEQVSNDDFFRAIDAESNSIAVLVKHIGGNLLSRWTDFLTTDGEKPTRDRDSEFVVANEADRDAIMRLWVAGWTALSTTLSSLTPADLDASVVIRGESMSAVSAMHRALAHVSQHVGQIVLLAKYYRSSDWKTLSIPRGRSADWLAGPHSPTR